MKVPLETFHLHGQTTRFCRQTRNLEMLYLSPWLLLRIEGLFNKPMQVLGKPVWREKTRLTSPEVRVAETSKAWRDLGRPLFSLDLPVDLARAATERATKSRGRLVSPEWIWVKKMIDIWCAGSCVKYHSLFYLVNRHDVTSLNFRLLNFAPNRYEKRFKMA